MAYNPYGQAPYGRPPGFSMGAPPGMGPPPSMGGAPGMSAPGTQAPPGVASANAAVGARPQGLPASFQGPANMPNINFSAPVIRLGTGPSKAAPVTGQADRGRTETSSRPGLGMDRGREEQQRSEMRDKMINIAPPTKEEIVRTIFVAGITEGCGGNEGIERILQTAGRLRRWDRAIDADAKECSFGFAQYEDPESLHTAVEVLKDIEVPVKKQPPGGVKKEKKDKTEDDIKKEDGGDDFKKEDDEENKSEEKSEDDEPRVEKKKLHFFIDDNSLNYLESWSSKRGDSPEADQKRLDSARAALKSAIHDLFYPPTQTKHEDHDGDSHMRELDGSEDVEVVNIPMAQADDELSDIPAEMREMVAKEIASFRDRSIRRDLERLKREEEMEAAERARNGAPRASRLASPTPTGPSGGSNNIPLGPRGAGVTGAPSGPKGSQMPRDYQTNVKFVKGTNGSAYYNRSDEDDSASDSELENRRLEKKKQEQEKMYLDQERRWLNRERSRTAAVEREKERDEADEARAFVAKEKMADKLKGWNDDEEAKKRVDEYYADRSAWIRTRAAFRAREAAADEEDRKAEERENERLGIAKAQARGAAESFLDQTSAELGAKLPSQRGPQQPFKLSIGLGAAAQKAHKAAAPRRTVAEVEGLLEDEEEEGKAKRRELIPIKYDPADRGAGLSDEEREQAIKDLAAEVPTSKEGLWDWTVKWEYVDEQVIQEKLKPFVERKIVEYLGVQEQTIVEVVEEHVRKRGGAAELVEALEGALDEEAEVLVKKLWRMLIFFSESEKRGLSA